MEMLNVKNIKKEYDNFNYKTYSFFINERKYNTKSLKKSKYKLIYTILLINSFLFMYLYSYKIKYYIIKYKIFINDCNNLKKYKKKFVFNKFDCFLSICIPVYNMELYISKALLSIINQSFENFEIIIVNDNSNDNTEKIIKNFQIEDNRIRIINHLKNLGVYCSRINAALNTNGKYILFMDPDDMLINPFLFEELFNYNSKYFLDMVEFSVYHQEEGNKKIYFPIYHELNHYHNLKKQFFYQPELSNIIFFSPNTNNYGPIFCRTIWNKIIRKTVIINTIKYIENFFHNFYLIAADDTPLNILNFNFACNYSNIKLPGYLYKIRKYSTSRIDIGKAHDLIVSYNFLLYFKFFYKYIKDFKKDLNFLLYDLKLTYIFLLKLKELNNTQYLSETIDFLNQIMENNISISFKNFIKNLSLQLMK